MLFPGKHFERECPGPRSVDLETKILFSITEDYNLELQYRRPFLDIWREEKDDAVLGPLSERMGVRGRGRGQLLVSDEEMEAASMFSHLHLIRQSTNKEIVPRLLSCLLLLQGISGLWIELNNTSKEALACIVIC